MTPGASQGLIWTLQDSWELLPAVSWELLAIPRNSWQLLGDFTGLLRSNGDYCGLLRLLETLGGSWRNISNSWVLHDTPADFMILLEIPRSPSDSRGLLETPEDN